MVQQLGWSELQNLVDDSEAFIRLISDLDRVINSHHSLTFIIYNTICRVITHLANLDKSENSKVVVTEKSVKMKKVGKVLENWGKKINESINIRHHRTLQSLFHIFFSKKFCLLRFCVILQLLQWQPQFTSDES